MYYGLTTTGVRKLAFEYGTRLEVEMPSNWSEYSLAGKDWLHGFMKRHTNLSLRKPQATSLARATSFNRHNVKMFFDNLQAVFDRVSIEPHRIWNMDETGITTVHKPPRVVGQRGTKQIGQMVSAERGTLVTLALAVSAGGTAMPPFYVFPFAKFKSHFLGGGDDYGAAGAANPSGWMKTEQFLLFLAFQRYCSLTIMIRIYPSLD